MNNIPIKLSLQTHVKHLMNLDKICYQFSKHHLFPFFVFNIIQRRQICLGAKLILSKSSNINERELLNEIQTINFDDIITNSQNIDYNKYICSLLRLKKIYSKYVMASRSSHATQRDQIFSMTIFMGMSSLFFTLNPTFVHHTLVAILSEQNINLDLFYDKNMLTKNEQCKYATINPKAQAIFVHIIVNVIFKYMLQVKNTKDLFNNTYSFVGMLEKSLQMFQL